MNKDVDEEQIVLLKINRGVIKAGREISTQTMNFSAGGSTPLMTVESLGGHPGSAVYLKPDVVPQCVICGGELDEQHSKRVGRFDVPVCQDCSPPTPPPTPRDLSLAPVVHETVAVLSGMEVEIFVRSYGPGHRDGIRFEAFDVLSANRLYALEENEEECLRVLVDLKKEGSLQVSDTFDPKETYESCSQKEEYWSTMLLALRLKPGTDRRTKILALKKRKPLRPNKYLRRTKSSLSLSPSPTKLRKSVRARADTSDAPPKGLDAGDSISSIDSTGSGGSMDSGTSFDFRVSSLKKAKRAVKAKDIREHEIRVTEEHQIFHGEIVHTTPSIKLAGIVCRVDVRHDGESENIFFHATDSMMKDYYLRTTVAECMEKLALVSGEPYDPMMSTFSALSTSSAISRISRISRISGISGISGPSTEKQKATQAIFHVFVQKLVWLEQVSVTERRSKKLTLDRPGPKLSKIKDVRKVRSMSPKRLSSTSTFIPAPKAKIPKYKASMGTSAFREEQKLKRKQSAAALLGHEELMHQDRKKNHGPIVLTRNVKLSGFKCVVEIRNVEGSDELLFHVKDDLLKEYTLHTNKSECLSTMKERGWPTIDDDKDSMDLFDLLPLFVDRLLCLEKKSETERRAKKLTLNQPGPRVQRVKLRKTRSMSPVPKHFKEQVQKETAEASSRAKRELVQAEIRALEHEAIRLQSEEYGEVMIEKNMKLANIHCAVKIRYKDEEKILFHAIDDQMTEYVLPATVKGCLMTMAVRGKRMNPDMFEMKEMVEMFVRYLLWMEPVDEVERRVKRLSLNKPPRKERRISMAKESTSNIVSTMKTGERKILRRMSQVETIKYESVVKKMKLPKIIPHKKSVLDNSDSLVHLHHTMRSIDYEISVFLSWSFGFHLTFVAYDEERERTYTLKVTIDQAARALTDSEAATLLHENHDDLHLEEDGRTSKFTDMKKVYTSTDAIRLYVDSLDIVRQKTNPGSGGTSSNSGLHMVLRDVDDRV